MRKSFRKSKVLSLAIIGIFFLFPLIRISNAQGSYVEVQKGDKYEWALSLYSNNWDAYMTDNLEKVFENLVPLGSSNLTKVFNDWSPITRLPQSIYSLTVNAISSEKTEQIFSPIDNTTYTLTYLNATFSWNVLGGGGDEGNYTWYILNDTSSFLRQTSNLTFCFSPYAMFNVLFVPTSINWSSLVSKFAGIMNTKGGLYKNISATAESGGFLLNIPALGFENNSKAILIDVRYHSNGVLSYYEFSYGEKPLVEFISYIPGIPTEYYYVFSGLSVIFIVEVIFYIYMRKTGK